MKVVLQSCISDRLQEEGFIASIMKEETVVDLYRRKIWLALDSPNVDNIGGRLVEDIGLQSRITQFKKQWLSQVLFDNVYKTH